MATAPTSRKLNLTRDQLATFLTDQQQIRQFEMLFATVDAIQVIVGTDFEYQADSAAATANEALAQLSALAQDTAVEDAVLNAKVQQALDAIPGLAQALELLALAPRQELGTIASQNSDNVNITGGLISGLDAPLPVASGGIGVTTAAANTVFAGPTAGVAAAPSFRALIAADIPALTYINSIGVTAPITSTGGLNPTIGITQSGTASNGYLSATDWNTFNNKAPATSGTSILYGNGSGGFNNVTIGTGVSFVAGTLSATGTGGTVTSVTGTSPVASTGGTTPAISLSTGYGDTQNPYASKTANFFLAAPNGAAGVPTFRAMVAADVPTLNQNTTGTASNVTGTVAVANGGTGATTAATARTNLGATTLGGNLYTLANVAAIAFPRFNADNTVSSLDAATFRTAIGAGTGSGTVTGVTASSPLASSGGTAPNITITGSALTKTDDTNVTLTLGGTPASSLLAAASLTLGWTGTLAVSRGGTGTGTAGIGAFNNITGYTASGATGTTSTNLVFSTSPTLTTPKATTTIGVGNATPSASGAGVSFPATQSASTDANTLDDYEEGTFTCNYSAFSGVLGSFGTANCTYTKIGRHVFVNATISGTGMAITTAGYIQFIGMPFSASVQGAGSYGSTSISSQIAGTVVVTGTEFWLYASNSNNTTSSLWISFSFPT